MNTLTPHQGWPFPVTEETVKRDAQRLVERAAEAGFVITIEQKPLQPLAMGHHETVVSVREARGKG